MSESADRPLRIVSWNMAHRDESWRVLVEGPYDVALLQEAGPPPIEIARALGLEDRVWKLGGVTDRERGWCAAVVGLSDRVEVKAVATKPVDDAGWEQLPVSRTGSLAVAKVTVRESGASFTAASMYGAWESPRFTEKANPWIFSDASVHRVISDLSSLIGTQRGHRILAAGDLNLLRGHGENGSDYWRKRYDTVFTRMEALGLPCIGPELAPGVAYAGAPSVERPAESRTVPTFRSRAGDPMSATRQLDYVFASAELAKDLRVCAADRPSEWGPSDHCRIEIEFSPPLHES